MEYELLNPKDLRRMIYRRRRLIGHSNRQRLESGLPELREGALLLSVNFSEIPDLKSQVLMTLRQAATKKRMV